MYRRFGKRLGDILVSATALILLSPVLLLVSILARIKLGSPVIFRQRRPGYNGRIFTMYKFRTMTDARDDEGQLLADAERQTKFGLFLRCSSLDELPELWNVLIGNMSLVGPRPLHVEYLSHYTPEQARRHDVLPGITGWAQVNGRHNLTFSKRFILDVWYVDNLSLALDLKILYMTVRHVLVREGVKADEDLAEIDDIGLAVDLPKPGKSANTKPPREAAVE